MTLFLQIVACLFGFALFMTVTNALLVTVYYKILEFFFKKDIKELLEKVIKR